MFIDARTLPSNTLIKSDLCIIGAGPAEISLASEFINEPFTVCLLESGGLEPHEATQSLSTGQNIGLSYFPLEIRLRQFGGTLGNEIWCSEMDSIDFEKRDWVEHSGWPITLRV